MIILKYCLLGEKTVPQYSSGCQVWHPITVTPVWVRFPQVAVLSTFPNMTLAVASGNTDCLPKNQVSILFYSILFFMVLNLCQADSKAQQQNPI